MTVKELIEKLKQFDENNDVVIDESCLSDNPQYPPRELTADNFNENDAAVIGKVIAVIKNFNRNMM